MKAALIAAAAKRNRSSPKDLAPTTTIKHATTQSNNNNKDTTNASDWQHRLNTVLRQQRRVLNFKHYTVSDDHATRMKELADTIPEVFDNPSSTPRSQWFDHPKFGMNTQMPQFHVHFRLEMQEVLRRLQQAHQSAIRNDDNQTRSSIALAVRTFMGSMRGLHGHVSIEEGAYFPYFERLYPTLDFRFLYEDHEHLHSTEARLTRMLSDLMAASDKYDNNNKLSELLVDTIEVALDFDEELMSHLGEEEEIVVPMSLALKGRMYM